MEDMYITSDIYLTATLQALGFRVEQIKTRESDTRKQAMFVINPDNSNTNYIKTLGEFVSEYYADKDLGLSPRFLFDHMRQVKSRMYAELK